MKIKQLYPKMSPSQIKQYYTRLKANGKFVGTIADAIRKRKLRQSNTPPAPPANNLILNIYLANCEKRKAIRVPLGVRHTQQFLERAKQDYKRLQEWSLGARAGVLPIGDTYHIRETGSNSDWNKKSTFLRGIEVNSQADIRNARICKYTLGATQYTIKAPRGYKWDIDENGLRLVDSKGNDYHPDSSELVFCSISEIVNKLKQLKATRIQQAKLSRLAKREEAEFLRMLPKLQVRLQDSRKAGNCIQGTISYASRHGISQHEITLDPTRYLPGSRIDRNDTRAMNAAKQAFYRETLICI